MIEYLILITLCGGLYLYLKPSSAVGSPDEKKDLTLSSLPDIEPENQGGSWPDDFDDAFKKASENSGVPFALMKAHAIRESNLDPHAVRYEKATSSRPPSASYGLMQILWWPNSSRFESYGFSDDMIGDGSILYDPYVNAAIASQLIKENYLRFKNLRDTINAYNTGVAESRRVAPGNYVDNVLKNYSTLVGRTVA